MAEVSGASRASPLVGDVLLAVDGALLETLAWAGDAVSLRVMRGGRIMVVEVRLEEPGRAA